MPGLLIAGAGVGMVLAPLAEVVLRTVTPEQLGSGSGIMTTTQQVGNSLGVALIGLVFFGLLGNGDQRTDYATAFAASLGCLMVVGVVVIGLVRWLTESGRVMVAPTADAD